MLEFYPSKSIRKFSASRLSQFGPAFTPRFLRYLMLQVKHLIPEPHPAIHAVRGLFLHHIYNNYSTLGARSHNAKLHYPYTVHREPPSPQRPHFEIAIFGRPANSKNIAPSGKYMKTYSFAAVPPTVTISLYSNDVKNSAYSSPVT